MTRLPFLLDDLVNEIAALSPETPMVAIVLSSKSFNAVDRALADHFSAGSLTMVGASGFGIGDEIKVGGVIIRRA